MLLYKTAKVTIGSSQQRTAKKLNSRGNRAGRNQSNFAARRNAGGSLMSYRSKSNASLFLSASFFVLAASIAPVMAQEAAQTQEAVIVTGTRVTGMVAADSAAPVTVLGSDALTHVGQPNLIQSLSQTL
ncbi:MAG TPA: hypothetical protein VLL04_14550, partial [Rhizomicrobium sp.]|nr:hypothetical protein [Rhizomicrobium sp.]